MFITCRLPLCVYRRSTLGSYVFLTLSLVLFSLCTVSLFHSLFLSHRALGELGSLGPLHSSTPGRLVTAYPVVLVTFEGDVRATSIASAGEASSKRCHVRDKHYPLSLLGSGGLSSLDQHQMGPGICS